MMMLRDHEISIHALREEGDCTAPAGISIEWDFYPRPPRGGRRPSRRDRGSIYSISIHALREEGDPGYVQGRPAAFCISIHALREEGDLWMICFCWSMEISIHALREEGDIMGHADISTTYNFYPRPPRGGRPLSRRKAAAISAYFYPRPPRGGRQMANIPDECRCPFLSTPSARRATEENTMACKTSCISIHALREEGDNPKWGQKWGQRIFLSTPSARRATAAVLPLVRRLCYFYPRPPRGGRLR